MSKRSNNRNRRRGGRGESGAVRAAEPNSNGVSREAMRTLSGATPSQLNRAAEELVRRALHGDGENGVNLGLPGARPSRLLNDYVRSVRSADALNESDRENVVRFSRELHNRSDVYASWLDAWVRLIVGTGLLPIPAEPNGPAADACRLFCGWANTEADIKRQCDWGGLLRRAAREVAVAGDTLLIKVADGVGGGGSGGGQALQLIESEQISKGPGQLRDPKVVDGVQVDELGRPGGYWVTPYARTHGGLVWSDAKMVDARHAVYLCNGDRMRPSQRRGLPLLMQAMEKIASAAETHEAIEINQKLSACMVAIMLTANPGATAESFAKVVETSADAYGGGTGSARRTNHIETKPGMMMLHRHGDDIKSFQGSQPSTGYKDFHAVTMTIVSALAGIPKQIAMGDYEGANFSVARMAKMHAAEAVEPFREYLINTLCAPIYRWRIARLVLDGLLPDDPAVYAVEWSRPVQRYIEPEKEVKADVLAVDNNLATKQDVVRKRGGQVEQVFRQRGHETAMENDLGIKPAPMPGAKPAGSPADDDGDGAADGAADGAEA